MPPLDTEFDIYDLAADVLLEICSYLGVHDQENMKRTNNYLSSRRLSTTEQSIWAEAISGSLRRICQWWRLNLSEAGLSRLVEVDGLRMPNQSEDVLEHALKMHVQKTTKILVLRHMECGTRQAGPDKFGKIVRAIEHKKAQLILLILRDCTTNTEYAGIGRWWLDPQNLTGFMLQRLIFATKKLILVNYTIWNALSGPALSFMDPMMPCRVPTSDRRFAKQDLPLPVVLPRHEFDCTKPFSEHYHAFIMAVDFNCPEVSPEIRNAVVQLYNSWTYSDAQEDEWEPLDVLFKCFNEGVPMWPYSDDFHADIPALRQLNPLTLNKLTMEALYRLYF